MTNEKLDRYRNAVKGKRIALLGYGISNRAAMAFLLACGAYVTVRDGNRNPDEKTVAELRAKGIPCRFGANYLDDIDEDILFKTPGIRADLPALRAAVSRGAHLTSEMEVFCELCPSHIFAVTGSDGKTTTTTILSEFLKKATPRLGAHVFLGGNIGTPLLPSLPDMTDKDFVVLELSSFQLHTMNFSPETAVITNVSPNHLNWHTSMEEYIDSKKNIFRGQKPSARLILNAENQMTAAMAEEATAQVSLFSSARVLPQNGACYLSDDTIFYFDKDMPKRMMARGDIRIPGRHNVENYLAAIAAAYGTVKPDEMQQVAREFPGVRHRIEFVAEKNGVKYYNNSIGTSPARTVAALDAFKEKVIVILGGYDKHLSDEPMLPSLAEKAAFVIGTGATGQRMLNALVAFGYPADKTCYLSAFDEAVRFAVEVARTGDTVLLSPAAASFDAFPNFEARGDRFCALVAEIKQKDENNHG